MLFKVGDEVTISHACPSYSEGWRNSWVEEMDNYIGRTGVILSIEPYGIRLTVDYRRFGWPPHGLSLISSQERVCKKIQQMYQKRKEQGYVF